MGSRTVYVGNLGFYTSESQVYAVMSSLAGAVARVIMGLHRATKTPCGFCFVEFCSPESALQCVNIVNGIVLDDRVIRCELDFGFRVR